MKSWNDTKEWTYTHIPTTQHTSFMILSSVSCLLHVFAPTINTLFMWEINFQFNLLFLWLTLVLPEPNTQTLVIYQTFSFLITNLFYVFVVFFIFSTCLWLQWCTMWNLMNCCDFGLLFFFVSGQKFGRHFFFELFWPWKLLTWHTNLDLLSLYTMYSHHSLLLFLDKNIMHNILEPKKYFALKFDNEQGWKGGGMTEAWEEESSVWWATLTFDNLAGVHCRAQSGGYNDKAGQEFWAHFLA